MVLGEQKIVTIVIHIVVREGGQHLVNMKHEMSVCSIIEVTNVNGIILG